MDPKAWAARALFVVVAFWPLRRIACWPVFQARVPGLWIGLVVLLILAALFCWRTLRFLRDVRLKEALWAFACLVAMLGIHIADLIQFSYRPAWSDPEGMNHPAVEVLVSREQLLELGLSPFVNKVFYAPGESDRDLFLLAGTLWRSYLKPVPNLAAVDPVTKSPKWRTHLGMPLSDAAWDAKTGKILALSERPAGIAVIEPVHLEQEAFLAWPWNAAPTLFGPTLPDGTVLIVTEAEGLLAKFEPLGRVFSELHLLVPEATSKGARFSPRSFSPHLLTGPRGGKRYLLDWRGEGNLLELDEGFHVTRALPAPAHFQYTFVQIFRFLGLAFDDKENRAWVSEFMAGFGGKIHEVDLGSFSIRRSFDMPPGIRDLLFDPQRRRLYAINALDGAFLVYRLGSGGALELKEKIPLGRWARVLRWDEARPGKLLVATSAGLFRIDPNGL